MFKTTQYSELPWLTLHSSFHKFYVFGSFCLRNASIIFFSSYLQTYSYHLSVLESSTLFPQVLLLTLPALQGLEEVWMLTSLTFCAMEMSHICWTVHTVWQAPAVGITQLECSAMEMLCQVCGTILHIADIQWYSFPSSLYICNCICICV